MRVDITLAGDVTVRCDDEQPRTLAGPPRIVLAALLLEPPVGVARDRLAEIIWPDEMPRTWASALRTHVSKVRTLVSSLVDGAGETVVSADAGYQLVLPDDVTVVVDLLEAERAIEAARHALVATPAETRRLTEDAASCLRAPFLPGHHGPWVDALRARTHDALVDALELACAASVALGDGARAVKVAEEAVQHAPLRESAHRAVMAAYEAAGNRADALLAYQRLRRMLADELGVDPSPDTEAAYLDLLGPTPVARPARPPGADPPPGATRAPGTTGAPFVGRRAELAVLTEAWEQAAAGGRHLVVVTGEAGIGKSRLAAEVARHVSAQAGRVLFGRCDEEAIVPYQPLVEALDGFVAATPADELPVIGDEAMAELTAVLPSLAGPRRAAAPDRARLFGAVTDLVATAAKERPVLLVLDDLQWADDDTLLLVRHLLRWAGDAPVLVVAISRDHDLEPGHALAGVIHSLDRDGWVRRLSLGGLDEAEVRELLTHVHGAGDHSRAARTLVEETAGNPFLVTELAQAGGDTIPQSVQDLVGTRLAHLEPAVVDLLRAGAVAGARFDLDVTGEVAGLAPHTLLDVADAALASGLVVEETADRYRFPHDIVRRTLVAQLSGARRRSLHRRTADALEHLRARTIDDHVAVLAHHSSAGADPAGDERAVHWARRASARAVERSAPAEVLRLCRQALAHVPPGDHGLHAEVSTELGIALLAAGDDRGARTLADGARAAARHDRPSVLARAALALADAADDQPALRREARDLVASAVEATATTGTGAVDHARLLVRQLRQSGATEGPPPRAALTALHDHLSTVTDIGALDQRLRLATELAVLAQAADDPGLRIQATHEQAMAAANLGDEPAVRAAVEAMTSLAAEHDDPFGTAMAAGWQVTRLTIAGRFAQARAALSSGDPVAPTSGGPPSGGPVAPTSGGPSPGEAPPGGTVAPDAVAAQHLAVIGWLCGDGPPLEVVGPGYHDGPPALHQLGLMALAACDADDPAAIAEARALLSPYADLVCGLGYRTFVGAASFHLGRLAVAMGDWADAERHLLAALRLHSAWRARPWVALTQAALAEVLDARGRPSDREWIAGLRSEADWVATDLGLRRF